MTQQEQFLKRLDDQDKVLEKLVAGQSDILLKMSEHRIEHASVDPSIKELVGILKGVKFLKGTILLLASIVGSCWLAFVWIKDHLHWKG